MIRPGTVLFDGPRLPSLPRRWTVRGWIYRFAFGRRHLLDLGDDGQLEAGPAVDKTGGGSWKPARVLVKPMPASRWVGGAGTSMTTAAWNRLMSINGRTAFFFA